MDCASSTRSWNHLPVSSYLDRNELVDLGMGEVEFSQDRPGFGGDVSVHNDAGEEVAAAIVTYKLTGYRPQPDMG